MIQKYCQNIKTGVSHGIFLFQLSSTHIPMIGLFYKDLNLLPWRSESIMLTPQYSNSMAKSSNPSKLNIPMDTWKQRLTQYTTITVNPICPWPSRIQFHLCTHNQQADHISTINNPKILHLSFDQKLGILIEHQNCQFLANIHSNWEIGTSKVSPKFLYL